MKKRKKSLVQRRKKKKLTLSITIISILLTFFIIGGTIAYLSTETNIAENTFLPSYVDCEVSEDFSDAHSKKDVKIQNTGDVEAYIRVKLLFNWHDEDGGNLIAKSSWTPDISIPSTIDWKQGSDGYYYYTKPVKPGTTTTNLIDSITLAQDETSRARQTLEIIAEAIQSTPSKVVTESWTYIDSSIISVNQDSSLSVN